KSQVHVGPHLRGRVVVRGYDRRGPDQLDLFAEHKPAPRMVVPTRPAPAPAAVEHLEGFPPGFHMMEGRGELGRGSWGVADDRGRLVWNLHPTKEAAIH